MGARAGWGKGPQPLSSPGAVRSTPCCAIAARRWPSCGAHCAPSKPFRPSRRQRWRRDLSPRWRHPRPRPPRSYLCQRPHPASPSSRTCNNQTNPRAAEILAIHTGRPIERTQGRRRVRLPARCRQGHRCRPHRRHAPDHSNPRPAGSLPNRRRRRWSARSRTEAALGPGRHRARAARSGPVIRLPPVGGQFRASGRRAYEDSVALARRCTRRLARSWR